MKIKFDASQQYQLDAIQAVVDLFNGQPMAGREFEINSVIGTLNLMQASLGFGNRLVLSDDRILKNLQAVQERCGINASTTVLGDLVGEDASTNLYRLIKGNNPLCDDVLTSWTVPHFSVEMETGTGKTYVYLRSIFELNKQYGFTKFIIVVPTVAIREDAPAVVRRTSEVYLQPQRAARRLGQSKCVPDMHVKYEACGYSEAAGNWAWLAPPCA